MLSSLVLHIRQLLSLQMGFPIGGVLKLHRTVIVQRVCLCVKINRKQSVVYLLHCKVYVVSSYSHYGQNLVIILLLICLYGNYIRVRSKDGLQNSLKIKTL